MEFDLRSHKPLREVVYDQLKMKILEGSIRPGTRMMEVALADEMGVSRTPVREAIRKLEKDGLVVIEPRRGAYASEISVKDIIDTLVVRENLEALSASITATTITPQQVKKLEEMTRTYGEAVRAGDLEEMIEGDELFHRSVVEYSLNKTLIQLSETVQELALRFRYLYYDDFSRYKLMPSEHTRIINALKDGDSKEAANAAREHVTHLKDFLQSSGLKVVRNRADLR